MASLAPIVFSPRYRIDIGPHVFPTQKYSLIAERLVASGIVRSEQFVEPTPASWDDLALVHTHEYLDKLCHGTMTAEDVRQLELPWSQDMVDGFRLMVGGTMQAALDATNPESRTPNPVAIHLGGGFHHAFPNHGEGFCPLNDVAVAVRVLQRRRGIERLAIIDLDVHHGNGTAFTFESDPRVMTCSMHQQHNYPMWKPASTIDVGLPDGAGDATYLAALDTLLPRVLAHQPECVFYLAGADPYEDDQLGGLRLTKDGLRRRDRMVIDTARRAGWPLVITLAGGYARRVSDTVAIHASTVEEAIARR